MVDAKKEKESIGVGRERAPEEFPTVESVRQAQDKSPHKPEENLEVESWITKIEKKFSRISRGAPGPQDDQVVVQQPASKQPPVTLPVTRQAMTTGQDAPVETGLRWLVTWALRQIKLLGRLGRRVELKDIPETKE